MTHRGWTEKPCHGCGSEEPHPTGDVCSECRRKLKAYEERNAAMQDVRESYRIYRVPRMGHNFPYLHRMGGNRHSVVGHAVEVVVQRPELADLDLGPDRFGDGEPLFSGNEWHGHDAWGAPVKMRPEVAEAIREMWIALRDGLENAYQEGLRHGNDFIGRMVSGEIKMDDVQAEIRRSR